jgi:hypothetical protein
MTSWSRMTAESAKGTLVINRDREVLGGGFGLGPLSTGAAAGVEV